MIKMTILGNLTADPEIAEIGCCNFTVAARSSLVVDGKPKTEFIRVSVWGKRGETVARFFHKGDPIVCVGDFCTNEYTDRNGTSRIQFSLRNADFDFIHAARSAAPSQSESDNADEEEDIFG